MNTSLYKNNKLEKVATTVKIQSKLPTEPPQSFDLTRKHQNQFNSEFYSLKDKINRNKRPPENIKLFRNNAFS